MRRAWPLLCCLLATCSSPQDALNRRVLQIAREYKSYGRVDYMNRWAPELCASFPSRARSSASEDPETHGRKLYYILARHRDDYYNSARTKVQPDGQVIVKESWHPVETAKPPEVWGEDMKSDAAGAYSTTVARDGKSYSLGAQAELFIMLKQDREWQFATVTPDGSKVIQAGRLAGCLSCHRSAKPDLVFGLPSREANPR